MFGSLLQPNITVTHFVLLGIHARSYMGTAINLQQIAGLRLFYAVSIELGDVVHMQPRHGNSLASLLKLIQSQFIMFYSSDN